VVTTQPSRPTCDSVTAPPANRAKVRDLLELTKPRITTVVLATSAAGMTLAQAPMPAGRVWVSLLGTALIVSSANALNMWWERDTDGLMARTRGRPLPAGRMAPDVALIFGLALGAVSLPLLFLVNTLTALLGLFALVVYVAVYTPLKRHTTLALLLGAIPGAMPPLMGWTSATGSLGVGGLALFAVLFVWQLPHFIAITLFRAKDYAAAGLKVVPIESGERAAKWQIVGYTALLLTLSLAPSSLHIAGRVYLAAAGLLGGLFLALSAYGLWAKSVHRWAKSLFGYSIVYLVLLFAMLLADKTAG
jgi:protoheme IX farnesyltransferase